MRKYLVDCLIKRDYEGDNCSWYSDSTNSDNLISDHDISLLINSLMFIIENDFRRIKKLIKYLKTLLLYLIY